MMQLGRASPSDKAIIEMAHPENLPTIVHLPIIVFYGA